MQLPYTFYHEFTEHNRTVSHKTCLAVRQPPTDGGPAKCIGPIDNGPNPRVGPTSASGTYLKTFCREISEEAARMIHPALFDYLDPLNQLRD